MEILNDITDSFRHNINILEFVEVPVFIFMYGYPVNKIPLDKTIPKHMINRKIMEAISIRYESVEAFEKRLSETGNFIMYKAYLDDDGVGITVRGDFVNDLIEEPEHISIGKKLDDLNL